MGLRVLRKLDGLARYGERWLVVLPSVLVTVTRPISSRCCYIILPALFYPPSLLFLSISLSLSLTTNRACAHRQPASLPGSKPGRQAGR